MCKKGALPLYGESCHPVMIVSPVNMTSPASAAEQLASGFDSGPGILLEDSPERQKTNFPEGETRDDA